jgi:hypothetical protein
MSDFEKELTSLLNRYSKENASGTPDFILAGYFIACLKAYEVAVIRRDDWRGFVTEFKP